MVTNYLTFIIQERKIVFDQFLLRFSTIDHRGKDAIRDANANAQDARAFAKRG